MDPDGDKLQFGVRQQPGSDVIRVESTSASESNIYLNQELDREVSKTYLRGFNFTHFDTSSASLIPSMFSPSQNSHVSIPLSHLFIGRESRIKTIVPYHSTLFTSVHFLRRRLTTCSVVGSRRICFSVNFNGRATRSR